MVVKLPFNVSVQRMFVHCEAHYYYNSLSLLGKQTAEACVCFNGRWGFEIGISFSVHICSYNVQGKLQSEISWLLPK